MAEKKGFFSRLQIKKKGCCCNIRIEEIGEEEAKEEQSNQREEYPGNDACGGTKEEKRNRE